MKVLVVDDQAGFRAIVLAALRRDGSSFVECEDGAAALNEYATERPDWVVMDIRMAPMDGLTATKAIRSRDPLARIVILTGCGEPDVRAAALNAGASFFVNKTELLSLRQIIYGAPQLAASLR